MQKATTGLRIVAFAGVGSFRRFDDRAARRRERRSFMVVGGFGAGQIEITLTVRGIQVVSYPFAQLRREGTRTLQARKLPTNPRMPSKYIDLSKFGHNYVHAKAI